MKAEQRLWWNADRTQLVAEDDPAAAFLAYPAGHEIRAEHQHLVAVPDAEYEQPDTKPVEQAPNKQRRPQAKK